MMKRILHSPWFNSIYVKFAIVFLGIWWFFNAITFTVVIIILRKYDPQSGTLYIQRLVGFVYLSSAFFGTVIILFAVRSIVRPLKKISQAARKVANGNFDVQLNLKNHDEIGTLAQDFNVMVKEINSIDTMRSDFVSNMSHEFRTPITSIKGYAKLIYDSPSLDERTRKYSEIIMEESDLLIELSSNLLRLSELDSLAIQPRHTLFRLDEQIRQVIVFLQPIWEAKRIEFDIDFTKIEYSGDEDLLRQVWLNLIQNAIKFSHVKGIIAITIKQQNNKIQITVKDNGVGIPREEVSHIFERFYKGNITNKDKGNGLGLFIVMKIVEHAQGTITAASEIDTGTTVKIELPIIED